jgi:ligand-binding sensor domain-containing protein
VSSVRKSETTSVLVSLIQQLDAGVWIEDENGKVLLGDPGHSYNFERTIIVDNDLVGVVKGMTRQIFADILDNTVQKEAEKKKLGSEVLNLYQEINLIYNFSERFSSNH